MRLRCALPALVMPPLRTRLPLESSLGNTPQYPISFRALWKREEMLPNSDAIVTAEICATPRKACRPPNYVLHGLRCQLYHFENGFLQPLHPCAHVLDFVHTTQTRDFLRRLRMADLRQPPHVTLCPCLQSQRWTLTRAQQKLG